MSPTSSRTLRVAFPTARDDVQHNDGDHCGGRAPSVSAPFRGHGPSCVTPEPFRDPVSRKQVGCAWTRALVTQLCDGSPEMKEGDGYENSFGSESGVPGHPDPNMPEPDFWVLGVLICCWTASPPRVDAGVRSMTGTAIVPALLVSRPRNGVNTCRNCSLAASARQMRDTGCFPQAVSSCMRDPMERLEVL
jgi:hypothetical protein